MSDLLEGVTQRYKYPLRQWIRSVRPRTYLLLPDKVHRMNAYFL